MAESWRKNKKKKTRRFRMGLKESGWGKEKRRRAPSYSFEHAAYAPDDSGSDVPVTNPVVIFDP